MPVFADQNALSTTAERLFTERFTRSATVTDPIEVTVRNDDAAIVVYIGDSDVTSSNGFALIAGAAVNFSLKSPADWREVWAIAASGTPELHILAVGPVGPNTA